jgi:hypothetical protein
MQQYTNSSILSISFGKKIVMYRKRSITFRVVVQGHGQCIRIIKHKLRIYKDGERVSYDHFKRMVLSNRSDVRATATVRRLTFDPHCSTAKGMHVNGPAEMVIAVDGSDYLITTNFAKLM